MWVEGIAEPIVASRTERAIVAAMGGTPGGRQRRLLDEALDLAHRVADAAEQGRFDVVDLGRRARRLLASTCQAGARGPLLNIIGRSSRRTREVLLDLRIANQDFLAPFDPICAGRLLHDRGAARPHRGGRPLRLADPRRR